MTKEELEKEAKRSCIDKTHYCIGGFGGNAYCEGYIDGAEPREKRIEELEHELENERKLNEEIKVRFVKCNTCTPDMKEKCLMFNENLCEGERCEELVDLMALVSKNDLQKENEQLKEKNRQLSNEVEDLTAYCNQIGKIKTDVLKLFEHIVAR